VGKSPSSELLSFSSHLRRVRTEKYQQNKTNKTKQPIQSKPNPASQCHNQETMRETFVCYPEKPPITSGRRPCLSVPMTGDGWMDAAAAGRWSPDQRDADRFWVSSPWKPNPGRQRSTRPPTSPLSETSRRNARSNQGRFFGLREWA
jgi:hypothetical protein